MKIFRLILILALGLQIGFGEGESSGSGQNVSNTNEDYKYYLKYQSKSIVNDGECGVCDEVKDGYQAQFLRFDHESGTTYCEVRRINSQQIVGYANRTVKSCIFANTEEAKQANKEYQAIMKDISSNATKVESSIGNINSSYSSESVTFSKFIAGLLTLDPYIIDRKLSKSGEIVLKKPIKTANFITLATDSKEIEKLADKYDKDTEAKNGSTNVAEFVVKSARMKDGGLMYVDSANILDAFNKNNMAYFSNLFIAMEKVYQHLQILLFVLIGGFFVMQIGANKLQAYLENRGESEGKQPYLHKFYIPLLMIGIFFMPIPEGNGHSSTVMQNMIRYFAQHSAALADIAHSAGAKVYIEQAYRTAGYIDPQTVNNIKQEAKSQELKRTRMQNIINRECEKTQIIEKCSHKVSDNQYTFVNKQECSVCFNLARELSDTNNTYNMFKEQENKINQYGNKIMESLKNVDKFFAMRNEQLGWIDILLTPTAGKLIQIYVLSEVLKENPYDMKQRIEDQEKFARKYNNILLANAQGVSVENIEYNNDLKNNPKNIPQALTGYIAGNLVWMTLPGAMAIKDFAQQALENILPAMGSIIGGVVGYVGGSSLPFIGQTLFGSIVAGIGTAIGKLLSFLASPFIAIGSYMLSIWIIKNAFSMIPLVVLSTAALVALLSYLVSLCKYFYISPFIVAWSMATKKVDKIIDFLITGISLFFRPVLIVLFVYLALFLHILVTDFFIFASTNQFVGISIDWKDLHTSFLLGAISGLLEMFGILAASYVIWKLIVGGPGWALSLIGVDGKHDDMMAGALENKLASRAFVA